MRLSELLSIYFILLLFEAPSLAATLKHQNKCSTDKAWNRLGAAYANDTISAAGLSVCT